MSEKTYFDTDGSKRSLNWMTRNEPEWAANVIRTVKVKNTELKELISTLVELMERSDMEEFGEDCHPVNVETMKYILGCWDKAVLAAGEMSD